MLTDERELHRDLENVRTGLRGLWPAECQIIDGAGESEGVKTLRPAAAWSIFYTIRSALPESVFVVRLL